MAGDAYIWERLPELTVKGKSATIVAHALTGSLERASRRKTRFELALVGRRGELAALDDALDLTLAGDGRIVGIAAEAGMGKSRLVAEFVRSARRRGLFVAFGECQSFGTDTSYFVWREIWRRLFDLDDDAPPARQLAALETVLAGIAPGLVARAPLLASLVGLDIPDNALTASLEAKVRKASLEDLLSTCLRARSARDPIVLVLEDCHWIDPLSRDLLEVLGRTTAALPVLIVLAYRPAGEVGGGLGIERIPDFAEIALDVLDGRGRGRAHRRQAGPGRGRPRRPPPTPWSGWSPIAPAAIPSTSRSSSASSPAAAWTSTDPAALQAPRAARQPAQPGPVAHRPGGRGAAPDAQGGERRRSRLRGTGAAGRLPGTGHHRRCRRAPCHPPGRGPGQHRSRCGPGLPVQARRDPGGGLREPALRRAHDAPRPRRALAGGDPTRPSTSSASTCSPTTSG